LGERHKLLKNPAIQLTGYYTEEMAMKFYTLPGEQRIPALGFGYRFVDGSFFLGPGAQKAQERLDPLSRTIGYD
jgi:hypothetical protein